MATQTNAEKLKATSFGKNPDNPKNNPVNETKLGYVTDPDIYWVGFHKNNAYKYIPVREYNKNNKLINAPPKWVKMTDDEKSKYMEKIKKLDNYYMVLADKPGTQKLYPFYPEGQQLPPKFKETTTTPTTIPILPHVNILGNKFSFGGTRRRNHKKRKTRKH
jgi:hypothetical protein